MPGLSPDADGTNRDRIIQGTTQSGRCVTADDTKSIASLRVGRATEDCCKVAAYIVMISFVNIVGLRRRLANWVPNLTVFEIVALFFIYFLLSALLLPPGQMAR